MAITVKELQTLIYLKKNGYLNQSESIIEIGAQQIANNFLLATDTIQELTEVFSVTQFI